jgi:hypothetical protein
MFVSSLQSKGQQALVPLAHFSVGGSERPEKGTAMPPWYLETL